jgi:type II secretory pathway pseudopilin PulG
LTELLVVLAILAARLSPGLGRAKKTAVQINCASNLKQVGTAIQMLVDDNENTLPHGPGSKTGLYTGERAG